MRITRIEAIPGQVPIRPELVIRGSLGVHATAPFVLVQLHTDEGITGLGEVFSPPSGAAKTPSPQKGA